MNATRFQFSVDRDGDSVLVAMDCEGLVRCRTMPVEGLAALIDACEQIRDNVIVALKNDDEFKATVPPYPECCCVAEHKSFHGICDVSVVASKAGKAVEFCCAFYDPGDETAPALVLIDEQLDEFLLKAKTLLS